MIVVPRPFETVVGSGVLPLTTATGITYADAMCSGSLRAAAHLRERLADELQLELQLTPPATVNENGIVLRRSATAASGHPEGYELEVTARGATVSAASDAGLFYGVQTILQLALTQPLRPALPGCRLVDHPRHPFRGVHLYVPQQTELTHFKQLIRYLARCKINTIVLEVGAAVELKRHPEINQAWDEFAAKSARWPFSQAKLQSYQTLHGRSKDSIHPEQGGHSWLSQDRIREIVDFAHAHHIDIVPEIQSPGHAFWLCLAHPEIAEWEADKYPDTFCPSNPRSYELLFDVMDELIALFRPRCVSSGGDEYYFYGLCPRCKGRHGSEILAGHLNQVNAFLRARGIQHLTWADKLINPDECEVKRREEWGTGETIKWAGGERVIRDSTGTYVQGETWQAIDLIPDDIIMADWYYALSPDTEQYFAKHGKQVIFGNFSPSSFRQFPNRLLGANVRGGEISTWIDNSRAGLGHDNWYLQAAIAADMFWSSEVVDQSLRIPQYAAFWQRQRDLLSPRDERLPSRLAPPASFVPVPLGSRPAEAELVVDPGDCPVPFTTTAVAVSVKVNEPYTIPLDRPLRSIVLLLGVRLDLKEAALPPLYEFTDYKEYFLARELAALTIEARPKVADPRYLPFSGRVPLRLGFELGALGYPCLAGEATRPSCCDLVRQPDGSAVYAYEWVNPNPENLIIDSMTMSSGRSPVASELVLFAVTVVS